MSSSVFFKFKSQKEPSRVTFDGTGISVFELKRDIISISRLGDGTDFDLAIYNPDLNEEYDDDTAIISRGTTVVARRLPSAKPGAGRAARYVSGKMPVTAKNQHRIEATKSITQAKPITSNVGIATAAMTEEERIAAMFDQGGEQWEQTQQQMANQKAVHRPGQKMQIVPDKPLPAGYTCHRCGEKGHWIQACPTNNDPNFDNRPKFRRTTGIPRSFLKVVEKPTALAEDGSVDVSKLPSGVMYTATGEWVVAEPDKASWEQFQAKQKASADKASAQSGSSEELREMGLECSIDKRAFADPVKTPCCGKTFCRDCIENALLSNDFVCPECSTENVLVDNLIVDDDAANKLKTYQDTKAQEAKSKEKSVSPGPTEDGARAMHTPSEKSESPTAQKVEAASLPNQATNGATLNQGTPQLSTAVPADSKKRPAEEDLASQSKRSQSTPGSTSVQNHSQFQVPNNMNDFVQQMNAMAQSLGPNGQMQNGMSDMSMMGMNGMGFPNMNMMGMPNPLMMNMGMGMGMGMGMNGMNYPTMPMGMPNMNGLPGMGMPGMGGMGMGMGMSSANMNGGGWNMAGPHQNQGGGLGGSMYGGLNQQQNLGGMQVPQGQWSNNTASNNGHEDAYFRKPINQARQQGRLNNQQRRQRSVDYREMGS